MDIFTPEKLKILATIVSVIASGILAYRVRNMLSALALVAGFHEVNLQQLSRPAGDIVQFTNSDKFVAQAKGMKLLVCGFALYGVSAALNFLALIMGS